MTHQWIQDGDDPAISLAVLAVAMLNEPDQEIHAKHMHEALDEFYALKPHLTDRRERVAA